MSRRVRRLSARAPRLTSSTPALNLDALLDALAPFLGYRPALAGTASSGIVGIDGVAMTRMAERGTATARGRAGGKHRQSPARKADEPRSGHSHHEPAPAMDDEHEIAWQLVKEVQAGNGEAFGKLYDRYFDIVFRFIYYRVGDRGLAEDFTSETFLRGLRRIHSVTYQGRDVGAWFITIARNIVFDHSKSARYRLEHTTADIIENGSFAQSTEAAVLESLTNHDLFTAINKLNQDQRECIVLRFMHGLSVNETAEAMGKNEGAIKALQHRAVRKLADLVSGEIK